MIKIICVCGARPNFMKIAPITKAFNESGKFKTLLVHTGQHYDAKMSQLFFEELNIPKPDVNLEVGSGSHAVQSLQLPEACGAGSQAVAADVAGNEPVPPIQLQGCFDGP